MKKKIIIILVIAVAAVVAWSAFNTKSQVGDTNEPNSTSTPAVDGADRQAGLDSIASSTPIVNPDFEATREVIFVCDEKKSINATLTIGGKEPKAVLIIQDYAGSNPDIQNESRQFTVFQVASTEGSRFVSKDGSVVFWSKDNDVFLEEYGKRLVKNCSFSAADL